MRCLLFIVWCLLSASVFAQQAESPINVNVVYPSQMQSTSSIALSGTVDAKQNAQLASLEAGVVDQLLVEIGDVVTKGQVLLTLNDDLGALLVESAKATLQASKVNLAEAQRLYKEVLVLSEQQVVAQTLIAERAALLANAEAELARSQANLALQQEILKRHTLYAPFDGVVASRSVDVGEWITQQTNVFTLVDEEHLRLNVLIPQQYYPLLSRAQNVAVKVLPDVQSAAPMDAVLSRFVPVSSGTSRSFQAQIDLPEGSDLAAGMSARAEIQIPNTSQNMFTLPLSAIKQHPDGGSSIFVVEDGKAKRIITPYIDLSNGMVSINQQPANLPYIVSGVELLRDGVRVTATNITETVL